MRIVPLLLLYTGMQVCAGLIAKYGANVPQYWLAAFILGNVINSASVWALMGMYRQMNGNIVMALSVGLAFVAVQVAMLLVFRQSLSLLQYAGIVAILVGLIVIIAGKDTETEATDRQSEEQPDRQPVTTYSRTQP